jgi:hypothetical protein
MVLLAASILLNIASLVIRRQQSAEYDRFLAAEKEKETAAAAARIDPLNRA